MNDRDCKPEWCETGIEPHSDECDNAPMPPMTKREFVDYLRSAASHAFDAAANLVDTDLSETEIRECAVEDVADAATCHAGIGSCGRGWCRHA